ncbi:hypothetical protein BDV93DRAFT_561521 [Ceratobasidium sp. AG-I]|nr:hypothetical protein BDV93DRAFT_561521 [Ceratobasidium sp. AG-I]
MSDMNSSAGTSVYRITPLQGTDNYNTWHIQMEDILTDLALYDYVTGDTPFPPLTTSASTNAPVAVTPKKEGDSSAPTAAPVTPPDSSAKDEQLKWLKSDWKALTQI